MAESIALAGGSRRTSRDIIPVSIQETIAAIRVRNGMRWEDIELATGLSARALCSPDRSKRGYRRWVIGRLGDHFDSPELRRLAASDIYWDRIVSVEPDGMSETYDLTVEGDHNFVANDLIVHNSHAASFALLAYASAYLKAYHPAAFYAALLNNQPMGFYDPATIVGDAGRHGQVIRPAEVNYSGWLCTIEPDGTVRLGLRYVRGLREDAGLRLEAERQRRPFASVEDLVKRGGLRQDEVAQLARVGALASLEPERRAALWEAERAGRPAGALYEGLTPPRAPSPLRPMTAEERLLADYEGTGLTLGPHPMAFRRGRLGRMGVSRAADLAAFRHGAWVKVAGAVVVRQRPGTAKGFVFLNLEDETGLVNIIVRPPLFHRHRLALVNEPFLLIEGTLQRQDNVTSVRAERLWPLRHRLASVPSHDFH
jgi:error-prone DNA polymerase